jgi:hypothetical protein
VKSSGPVPRKFLFLDPDTTTAKTCGLLLLYKSSLIVHEYYVTDTIGDQNFITVKLKKLFLFYMKSAQKRKFKTNIFLQNLTESTVVTYRNKSATGLW